MISARGYATHGPQSALHAFAFEREEQRERDVQIQVLFCGVCHSNIHQAKNEWSNTVYLPLLKRDCTLVVVGALEVMAPVNNQQVAFHRRSISGSLIGSIAETQEVIDFCARHGIGPDIEMLRIQDLNEAYARIEQGEIRFRYLIDMASLAEESVPTTLA